MKFVCFLSTVAKFCSEIVVFVACLGFASLSARADTTTLATSLGPLVEDVEIGPKVNFEHRSLTGSSFVNCDFSSANFDGADLGGAVFIECDFSNASFRGASFSNSSISNCSFSESDLTDAIISFVHPAEGGSHADFYVRPEQLRSTRSWKIKDLRGYAFPRGTLGKSTNLSGFDLRQSVLVGGDFRDVSFQDARIAGASIRADVDFEQLRDTQEVRNGRFPVHFYSRYDCDLRSLDLDAADLQFEKGTSVNLDRATLKNCSLQFNEHLVTSQLQSTESFSKRAFKDVRILNANLENLAFDRFLLSNVRFSQCNLSGVSFMETAFASVTFSGCSGLSERSLERSWNGASGMMHLVKIR